MPERRESSALDKTEEIYSSLTEQLQRSSEFLRPDQLLSQVDGRDLRHLSSILDRKGVDGRSVILEASDPAPATATVADALRAAARKIAASET